VIGESTSGIGGPQKKEQRATEGDCSRGPQHTSTLADLKARAAVSYVSTGTFREALDGDFVSSTVSTPLS
jgi:hypothetical protein